MNPKLIERWQEEFEEADTETVQQMLAEAPALVNVKVNRTSPLFSASINIKDLDKVKALIEAGADVDNNDLSTHWPSKDYEINRYLISRGTDVNQPSYLGFHAVGVSDFDSLHVYERRCFSKHLLNRLCICFFKFFLPAFNEFWVHFISL